MSWRRRSRRGSKKWSLVTGRGKRAIEDHFDVAFELEEELKAKGKHKMLSEMQRIADMVTFCYIRQKKALGLGHAVLTAKRVVGNEPFAVLLGDDIIDAGTPVAQADDGRVPAVSRDDPRHPESAEVADAALRHHRRARRSRTAFTS